MGSEMNDMKNIRATSPNVQVFLTNHSYNVVDPTNRSSRTGYYFLFVERRWKNWSHWLWEQLILAAGKTFTQVFSSGTLLGKKIQ
jgi:hypothetical protein